MSRKKFTKTATFLFPLLNVPKSMFECSIKDPWGRLKYTNRFINAYCSDTTISKYVNDDENKYVFLVLENYQDVDFGTFYSTITAFPNYVDDYEEALFSDPYAFATKRSIMRFLFGYTKYVGPEITKGYGVQTRGWSKVFEGKSDNEIKSLLVKSNQSEFNHFEIRSKEALWLN